jgi:uncharacterized protein (DUF1684 family)
VATEYERVILAWRQEKEEALRADHGWLSLVGLFWLTQGEHLAGSGPDCAIRLPEGAAPCMAGSFLVRGEEVIFRAAPGHPATSGAEPLDAVEMAPDISGAPTKISVGNVTMALIRRGGRLAIRVWDRGAARRRLFPGRKWFPIDARYRVIGDFERFGEPRTILVPDVSGGVQRMESPGAVAFVLHGEPLRLTALEEDEGSLFLIFADATSGTSTYPAGRYLYTSAPNRGALEIDFNRAYNPPCAFTPYATCPLPLPENRLAITIEAGEKYEPENLTP